MHLLYEKLMLLNLHVTLPRRCNYYVSIGSIDYLLKELHALWVKQCTVIVTDRAVDFTLLNMIPVGNQHSVKIQNNIFFICLDYICIIILFNISRLQFLGSFLRSYV